MPKKREPVFGGDAPKQDPKEDRLGYDLFAKQIADVIVRLRAPNGYVIGLHGRWGSGKSTILNFTVDAIDKHNAKNSDNVLTHIDYRPWLVSGHQDLVAAFFKVLSEKLEPKEQSWFRRCKKVLGLVDGSTDKIIDATATIAKAIDPSGGVAVGVAGSLLKAVSGKLLGRFVAEPSLQKSYENLRVQLEKSGRKFIVTIDDIDRLENNEIISIMQMVKSIGQLPNVVYLLAYDRMIVWNALRQGSETSGPHFAEKIVQQEIELPRPTRNALLKMLDKEISFLTESSDDSTRWQYILRDGVHRWMRSPRDVVRLSNAVNFCWPILEGELDPQDLLAIEGLRLFDKEAYDWIRESRDFLFNEGRFVFAQDNILENYANRLTKKIFEADKVEVLNICTILFPQIKKYFEKPQISVTEPHVEMQRRRGLGSEAGYDTYFTMMPSSDAVPQSDLKLIVDNLNNRDTIGSTILRYVDKNDSQSRPMLSTLLDELRVLYSSKAAPEPTQALLDALFGIGEKALSSDWDSGLFVLSPRAQLSFLIRLLLEKWGREQAGQHLVAAFEQSDSVAFMADIFVDRGREAGIFESSSQQSPVIEAQDFERLGQILLPKIVDAEASGKLAEAPFYFDIARSWEYCSPGGSARRWLAMGMRQSADFLSKVGRGLVSYSVGTSRREYTMRDDPEPSLYDIPVIIETSRNYLEDADLTDDRRSLFTELIRGSERVIERRAVT